MGPPPPPPKPKTKKVLRRTPGGPPKPTLTSSYQSIDYEQSLADAIGAPKEKLGFYLSLYYSTLDLEKVSGCYGNLYHPEDPSCTEHCTSKRLCLIKQVGRVDHTVEVQAEVHIQQVLQSVAASMKKPEPNVRHFDGAQVYKVIAQEVKGDSSGHPSRLVPDVVGEVCKLYGKTIRASQVFALVHDHKENEGTDFVSAVVGTMYLLRALTSLILEPLED